VRARIGYIGGIDVKVCLTFTAIVNGMNQNDFDGTTGVGITDVMQRAFSNIVPTCKIAALRTLAFLSVAGTLFDNGRRQVVRIIDTCGRVGNISTGTEHSEIFREFKHNVGSMTIFQMCVKRNSTTWMLHSLL